MKYYQKHNKIYLIIITKNTSLAITYFQNIYDFFFYEIPINFLLPDFFLHLYNKLSLCAKFHNMHQIAYKMQQNRCLNASFDTLPQKLNFFSVLQRTIDLTDRPQTNIIKGLGRQSHRQSDLMRVSFLLFEVRNPKNP